MSWRILQPTGDLSLATFVDTHVPGALSLNPPTHASLVTGLSVSAARLRCIGRLGPPASQLCLQFVVVLRHKCCSGGALAMLQRGNSELRLRLPGQMMKPLHQGLAQLCSRPLCCIKQVLALS